VNRYVVLDDVRPQPKTYHVRVCMCKIIVTQPDVPYGKHQMTKRSLLGIVLISIRTQNLVEATRSKTDFQ